MGELDHKEDWEPKNLWFLIVVLEKTLESFLDSKDIKPVNPKGNQSWIFIGRTDAEAPILWPPSMSCAKSRLIGKDPDAGKDWGQEEKRATEDEMVGRHHQLNGHLSNLREIVKDREAWRAAVHGDTRVRQQLSNWTTTTKKTSSSLFHLFNLTRHRNTSYFSSFQIQTKTHTKILLIIRTKANFKSWF